MFTSFTTKKRRASSVYALSFSSKAGGRGSALLSASVILLLCARHAGAEEQEEEPAEVTDPLAIEELIQEGSLPDQLKSELLAAYVQEFKWTAEHNREVYEWHRFSTEIIFWTVIALVATGLALAIAQFVISWRRGSVGSDATNIKVGQSGFSVNSPVLGVILIFLSFLFFYLYLAHVYPVADRILESEALPQERQVE